MSSRLNDKREAGELLRYLHDRGVMVWRDDSGDVSFAPASGLTETTKEEITNLAEPLRELLEAEETVIIDPVEQSHSYMRTPSTPEMSREDKLRAGLTASKRKYMNGELLVNDVNNFGHYMRQLVRERERQQAIERGDAAPQGRYRTRFNVFD
jgi:hypothetical protein